ncbi:MAG: hypothetical protein ABIP79_04995 [Chitinophagaceae bacterium]
MAKTSLTRDTEFVVGEEKVLVYVMALLFFGLFVYAVIDAFLKKFTNLTYTSYLFALALLPAMYFFKKGRSNAIHIRINKTGIYQQEKLITGWANFLNAYVTQKEKTITIQDNFLLVIEFTKEGNDKGFRRKIPLTNTQNKSEEEVLEAVKFFWQCYQRGF